ncbi:MAG: translation initiation factor IF-1 [Bacilli bacterium]|jgi:translation initiation factor IF-1|nr:translation initiation factor IF-1 [Bacilli bacterium]
MSREDFIKMEGTVLDSLPGGLYSVQLDGGAVIRARISGKMRMNRIRILPRDRVTVEISPYDVTNGCIVYRYK